MKFLSWLLVLLFCCHSVQAEGLNPDRELVYKTINDVELKLHVFEPEGFKVTDKRPAIVFFFGGGWNSGTPQQFYQQARAFADQGMVAFSADYRVKSRNQTTPFECVKDAKSAVRWIREHAAEQGVDPDRIVASGGSAGGHIAGCTGVIYGCEEDGEDKGISSVPNLMILYNPVLDTTDKGYGANWFTPEQQTDLSLTHHVHPGIVPTLLFHGTADTTVPFENAERFTRLMKAAGNECILVPFEGKSHGFFNGSHFRARNGDEAFHETMVRSIEFLTRHGYLGADSVAELELVMPAIFADHMVLQRGQKVPVWGTADPGVQVKVTFAGQQKEDLADAQGKWKVTLDPLSASTKPRTLEVTAIQKSKIKNQKFIDVLVGEVWLASGQSNMYRPFRMLTYPARDPAYEPVAEYLRQEELKANDPLLRQFRVGKIFSPFEGNTVGRGNWSKAVVGPVHEFCAVAYFFGRELRRELKVPVAMISSNLGGTRIEPWIPPQAFKSNDTLAEAYAHEQAVLKQRMADWDKTPKDARGEDPSRDKQAYGSLYNGMIYPLIPYAVKGAIWYQGESNSGYYPEQYGMRLTALIEGWRAAWQQDKFTFLWCQLANYKQANEDPVGDEDGWAWVQDGQRRALALPDTGMAVLNDIGEADDVHPKNKVDAGKRLSLWALKQAYGRDLVCSGPLFKEAKVVAGGKVNVSFDHVGSGLMVGHKHLMDPTVEVDEPLKRFQICGPDGQWKWAQAKITGKDSVTVWHDQIKQPVEVRYAWSSNPEGANLYNKEGLPASIFKTGHLQSQ